jgi:hypothetical protein
VRHLVLAGSAEAAIVAPTQKLDDVAVLQRDHWLAPASTTGSGPHDQARPQNTFIGAPGGRIVNLTTPSLAPANVTIST